ncbi:SDR family oxidoreductase [Patescibacteria group bacterium]|nr:SDR family oxidoreductase [Patescibacteria group bacterium]
MNILVGGSAGFIGSHLVDRLLECGHKVTGLDNLITGQKENLFGLDARGDFRFVDHDICLPLPQFAESFDVVINLACPASPIDYQNIPLETLWVSAMGTKNLLELARKDGARFLHASTSEVYGDPLIHPQTEEYWGNVNPIGPRSCYDEGKRFAESLIVNYKKVHGVESRVFRIFNTYGPRMRKNDGRVIPNFITQALSGEPITIYGDGKQTRSFCYVDDMVDGIMAVMNAPVFSGPMNLGNPKETTILELAELIVMMTDSGSEIAFKNLPQDDPRIRQPNINKARSEIGFEPKVSLKDGLARTVTFFVG